VLARTRAVLEPVRALCEEAGIPVAWREDLPPLHRVRELATLLDRLRALGRETLSPEELMGLAANSGLIPPLVRGAPGGISEPRENPWGQIILDLIRAWSDEAGTAAVPATQILEFCYETLAEQRRDRSLGNGVLVATLHSAKGLEFPHVLIADGGWRAGEVTEEERRLFYVGMTRARETLTLGCLTGAGTPWLREIEGDWLVRFQPQVDAPPPAVVARRYRLLTLADLDLGYAGRFPPGHPVHARLAALAAGDPLQVCAEGGRVLLRSGDGEPVARLSRRGSAEWMPRLPEVRAAKILAMIRRRREDGDPAFRDTCCSDAWELPLVEIQLGERGVAG
jgi:ATP-dependent DNA helicase RecQ